MTRRDAFLAAILAAPDDRTPRLIFADWLEEDGGEERGPVTYADRALAEFIRVQCRLEQWSGKCLKRPLSTRDAEPLSQCCVVCDLRRREAELLDEQGHEWIPVPFCNAQTTFKPRKLEWGEFVRRGTTLIVPRHFDNIGFTFRGGFIERVQCPARLWFDFERWAKVGELQLSSGVRLRMTTPLRELKLTECREGTRGQDFVRGLQTFAGLRRLELLNYAGLGNLGYMGRHLPLARDRTLLADIARLLPVRTQDQPDVGLFVNGQPWAWGYHETRTHEGADAPRYLVEAAAEQQWVADARTATWRQIAHSLPTDGRPHVATLCSCHNEPPLSLRDFPPTPSETMLRQVALTRYKFREGQGPVWYHYVGQCPSCRVVWWTTATDQHGQLLTDTTPARTSR
jgi:uncharacterized protein (TIGR02996 family)